MNYKYGIMAMCLILVLLGGFVLYQLSTKNSSEIDPKNITIEDAKYDKKYVTDEMLSQAGKSQWGQFGFDPENSGRSPYAGPQKNTLRWVFQDKITRCGYKTVMTAPSIDSEGNLYFGTSEGDVIALSSGQEVLWRFTLPDAYARDSCSNNEDVEVEGFYSAGGLFDVNIDHTPAIDIDTVYFGTSGIDNEKKVFALDLKTGKKKWEYKLDGPLRSKMKIGHDGRIYFSTNDKMYSINKNGRDVRVYDGEISGWGAPAITQDGTIYACGRHGTVMALDSHFKKKWEYDVHVENIGPCFPAVNPTTGNVYFPIPHVKKLYAFNSSGKKLWSVDVLWSESSPAIGKDGSIYLGVADISQIGTNCDGIENGSDGFLYSFNVDGSIRWKFSVPTVLKHDDAENCYDNTRAIDSSPIIDTNGIIYFGTDAQKYYALNSDGSILWEIGGSSEFDRTSAISSDGTIYFAPAGGGGGGLFAVSDVAEVADSLEGTGAVNQACFLGNEKGMYCDVYQNCSSGEFVEGCCIEGVCLVE